MAYKLQNINVTVVEYINKLLQTAKIVPRRWHNLKAINEVLIIIF